MDRLSSDIAAEEARPKKSFALATMGSIVMPGFGYFYTGNYKLGAISLLSNACFIALAVHGVLTGNIFQLMFFGLIELSFYQNSIYGAMRSVAEYNSNERFTRRVRLQMQQHF